MLFIALLFIYYYYLFEKENCLLCIFLLFMLFSTSLFEYARVYSIVNEIR